MKKMIFGIDIDDVLADLHKVMWSVAGQYIPLDADDRRKYFLCETKHGTPELDKEVFTEITRRGLVARLPVISTTVGVVNRLHGEGHKIILITARQEHLRKQTKKWLGRVGVKYDELIMTQGNKGHIAQSKGVSVLVDDRLDVIEEATKRGIKGILFDRPWNRRRNDDYHRIDQRGPRRSLDQVL